MPQRKYIELDDIYPNEPRAVRVTYTDTYYLSDGTREEAEEQLVRIMKDMCENFLDDDRSVLGLFDFEHGYMVPQFTAIDLL